MKKFTDSLLDIVAEVLAAVACILTGICVIIVIFLSLFVSRSSSIIISDDPAIKQEISEIVEKNPDRAEGSSFLYLKFSGDE